MAELHVCYGPAGHVLSLAGDALLIDEVHTALFTSAALEMEAPHDCDRTVWCDWWQAVTIADDGSLGSAGGGQSCVAGCPNLSGCRVAEFLND